MYYEQVYLISHHFMLRAGILPVKAKSSSSNFHCRFMRQTQKVVFDTKNQGIFNKSVFILSNAENKRVSLNIKGHVKSEENK